MNKWILILLLFLTTENVVAKTYHYQYTANCAAAYQYYMALQPENGRAMLKKELISDPYNLMATYIGDYEDCLHLLFNGNPADYAQLKNHQSARLNLLERGDKNSPWYRLCKAGVYMHWAFVSIRFNENFKAATNFRKSYLLLKENKRLFPSFEYNDIFLGIEEASAGAIPDNYKWIASIFGVSGNIEAGANKLKRFLYNHDAAAPLYNEAMIYYAYMGYYLLSDKELAWRTVSGSKFETEDNLLNSFVKCNIALNYRKAGEAINTLKQAQGINGYNRYPIFEYEYGYALLHKQDDDAIKHFNNFLKEYKGVLFVKDTWQKLSYAYYLNGDMKNANYCKSKISVSGSQNTDADKQAMRFAQQQSWPHKVLLQVQLLTDGGYFKEAYSLLSKTPQNAYTTVTHKLEYHFRVARVYDELGNDDNAVSNYNAAIRIGKNRQEQFAARSALHLGFLYEKMNRPDSALKMYHLALSMEDHDFKNSIDQQAKAGVSRLSK